MSRTGTFTVSGGKRQQVVVEAGVAPTTLVQIVPTSNPGSLSTNTFAPREIVKEDGVGFTINFIDQLPQDTTFDYQLVTKSGTFVASAGIGQTVVTDAALATGDMILAIAPTPPAKLTHGDFSVQSTIKTTGVGFTVRYNNTVVNTTTFDYARQTRTGTFTAASAASQVEVSNPGLAADAFITVQAITIPGALSNKSYSIRWIQKKVNSFVVYFNSKLDRPTTFDYVVL